MESDSSLYRSFGGMDACRRLSETFYRRAQRDPVLGPLFPSLHCAVESFTVYLAQLLGGPSDYSKRRWSLSLREAHLRFKIGPEERDAWLKNMRNALDQMESPEPLRDALQGFFERSSAGLVNRGEARPTGAIPTELARQWNVHAAIEEIVATVRKGDAGGAVAMAESPILQEHFERDRAALLSLLALMSGSGMHDYVRRRLLADPALARESYTGGRTLLHGAAGAGSVEVVELLLTLGADPNAIDQAGHAPLYGVGNGCGVPGGGELVRALARAGANLDAQDGVKHCTALHMAARRGNVEVAEALLDCGANLEARDSKGETPLRRAVNCGKISLVTLLLERGADPCTRATGGRTPFEAARQPAMKALLESYRR
jgi:truncated hemoglobin YjbI